jgi:long-chain acyl-CoA synthetase
MLHHCFLQHADKLFLTAAGTDYTYGWLQQKLRKVIGLFYSLDVRPGDRIILSTTNDVEIGIIFLAALNQEIGVIIIDPDTRSPRVEAIINTVSPAAVIADVALLKSWQLENKSACKVLAIEKDHAKNAIFSHLSYTSAISAAAEVAPKTAQHKDQLAYLMFTSGTTSEPKGVAITHLNLVSHLQTLQKAYGLSSESMILNQLMLSHADGLIQGPVLAAYTGCTLHRPFTFSISTVGELLEYTYNAGITHFFAVPTMLHFIEQHAEGFEHCFSGANFKLLISVSATLPKSLWESLEDKYKIRMSNVYGLTETVAGSIFCIANTDTYKRNTVGKPIDCEIKIVDEKNVEVQKGQKGELCLKGPHIMQGYWKNEVRTKEVIKDGWLHTGDYATADREGFISITGRKKNTIISGGLNIQPEEITECLLYNKNIREAFAFGMPDEILGDKLVVAIVPAKGVLLAEADVVDFCASWLEKKMLPQKVYITDELPKGISGKVQVERLRQLCESLSGNTEERENIEQSLVSVIAEIFHLQEEELKPDTDFFRLGGDSLLAALFIARIEQTFGVKVKFREIFKNAEIHALAEHIHMLQDEKASKAIKEDYQSKAEISRISDGDKNCKIVILANDYYEVNQVADYIKEEYECYFVQYRLTEKYSENIKNGINRVPYIEEIAEEIEEELRSRGIVSNHMILTGFSFGGLLAYEIAQRFAAEKLVSNLRLILLDAVVSDLRYPLLTRYQVKFRRKLDTIQYNIKNKVALINHKYLKGDKKQRFRAQHKYFVENHNAFKNAYLNLAKKVINYYKPRPAEEADVVLITSQQNEARNENNQYWLGKIKTGLTIVNVPGNHMTFLKEPHLGKWIPKLKQLLNEKCKS